MLPRRLPEIASRAQPQGFHLWRQPHRGHRGRSEPAGGGGNGGYGPGIRGRALRPRQAERQEDPRRHAGRRPGRPGDLGPQRHPDRGGRRQSVQLAGPAGASRALRLHGHAGRRGDLAPGARIIPVRQVEAAFETFLSGWVATTVAALREAHKGRAYYLETPPPKADADYIRANAEAYFRTDGVVAVNVSPAPFRRRLWQVQSRMTERLCDLLDMAFVHAPRGGFDAEGYMARECYWFRRHPRQRRLWRTACRATWKRCSLGEVQERGRPVSQHPYRSLPDKAFWRRSVAAPRPRDDRSGRPVRPADRHGHQGGDRRQPLRPAHRPASEAQRL